MSYLKFANLKENTNHGDFILPFSIYKGTINNSSPHIPVHWHEEMEVILIIDGSCNCKLDLDSFTANKGDILLISPQKLHLFHINNTEKMKWCSFVFNLEMMKSSDGSLLNYIAPILNHEHELPILIRNTNKSYSKFYSLTNSIIDCYNNKDIAYEYIIRGWI